MGIPKEELIRQGGIQTFNFNLWGRNELRFNQANTFSQMWTKQDSTIDIKVKKN